MRMTSLANPIKACSDGPFWCTFFWIANWDSRQVHALDRDLGMDRKNEMILGHSLQELFGMPYIPDYMECEFGKIAIFKSSFMFNLKIGYDARELWESNIPLVVFLVGCLSLAIFYPS